MTAGPDAPGVVVGLVLAAGAGRRFGRPKALVQGEACDPLECRAHVNHPAVAVQHGHGIRDVLDQCLEPLLPLLVNALHSCNGFQRPSNHVVDQDP